MLASITGEKFLNVATGQGEVARATDPNILPQPYATPGDFAAQYPTPLDTTELVAMCEEITMWLAIPDEQTSLKEGSWRELNELAFTSGSSYVSFADGACPEEYYHDGDNTTVVLKNIGAKKTLSESDIMHSAAVSAAGWNGINRLVGGFPAAENLPGTSGQASFASEMIADIVEKETRLMGALVLNNADRLLVQGNHAGNSLEFTGFESWQTAYSCTFRSNDNSASGTFSAGAFDRWLSEGCATPTHLFGHPSAIQEVLSSYFQLGFAGSQLVNFANGNRIEPGFNFASFVNTGIGRLQVVADRNFARSNAGGGAFLGSIWAMRMTHNGVPLVTRLTQIPLAFKDLTPGCTAKSFMVWAKTALTIKACCAQARWQSIFSGRIVSSCPVVG